MFYYLFLQARFLPPSLSLLFFKTNTIRARNWTLNIQIVLWERRLPGLLHSLWLQIAEECRLIASCIITNRSSEAVDFSSPAFGPLVRISKLICVLSEPGWTYQPSSLMKKGIYSRTRYREEEERELYLTVSPQSNCFWVGHRCEFRRWLSRMPSQRLRKSILTCKSKNAKMD